MLEPVWILDAVHLGDGERPRLQDVSLRIGSGVTGVIGPSGSGKTSLLNLLVGFETPDSGTALFDRISHADARPDGAALFWCPPDGGLWPALTVREHLTDVHPNGRAAAGPESDRLLRAFGLEDVADARPARLSAGQRQRVALARALATQARALVLDEPLVHVDAATARRCWEHLRAHIAAHSATVVVSSHDPATVLAEADEVICLSHGRVVHCGAVAELHERPPSAELARYLGEVNWLSAADAARWLDVEIANGQPVCYRAHRIEVVAEPQAPFVVVSTVTRGPTSEVQVRDERTGSVARFVHRSPAQALQAGARVVLRVCGAIALLALAGCGGAATAELAVTEVHHHAMPPAGARVPAPRGVAPGPDGGWLVLDNAGRVLVLSATAELLRSWSMPAHDIGNPEGICLLRDGRIAVADTHYHRVTFFDQTGRVLSTLGERGVGPGQFTYPVRLTQDDTGHLYVAEYGGNDRVQKFTADGEVALQFGRFGTGPGEFQRPSGIAWRDGVVYVADAMNHRVLVFRDDGSYVGPLLRDGEPALRFPYDLTIGPDERIYLVEYGAGCLTAVSPDGQVIGRLGAPGAGPRELATPWSLAAVSDRLLVADTGNRRLVEVRL